MTKKLKHLIEICLDKHLNFCVTSLPGSSDFEIIIEHHLLCSNVKSGFVLHPFEVSKKHPAIFIAADYRISEGLITDEFVEKIKGIESGIKHHITDKIISITKEKYLTNLQTEIQKLDSSTLDKFVYSRIETVENTTFLDLSNLLYRLGERQKNAFVYLVNHEKSGIWIGATPETLINWKNSKVSTMSLAGTQPKTLVSPLWTEKEIDEHDYVTKYIENAFIKNKIPCDIGETRTVEAGPVYHLRTEISSKEVIRFSQAVDLANSLHPTPAICGVPLLEAKEMIKKIETHDRAYYTGYLGFINPEKELQLFVNLRCMQVLPNSLALYLGGGITAKSSAEKEWEETNFKAKTLLQVLS